MRTRYLFVLKSAQHKMMVAIGLCVRVVGNTPRSPSPTLPLTTRPGLFVFSQEGGGRGGHKFPDALNNGWHECSGFMSDTLVKMVEREKA